MDQIVFFGTKSRASVNNCSYHYKKCGVLVRQIHPFSTALNNCIWWRRVISYFLICILIWNEPAIPTRRHLTFWSAAACCRRILCRSHASPLGWSRNLAKISAWSFLLPPELLLRSFLNALLPMYNEVYNCPLRHTKFSSHAQSNSTNIINIWLGHDPCLT